MNFAAVVLDLDGTLLNSDKQITDRNYKAIQDCYEKGMKIIFATARPPRAVRWLLPEELLRMGSTIFYNGAYIKCEQTGIHHHEPIEARMTAEVLEYGLSCNMDLKISLEVMDEWLSLEEYDYTAYMKVQENPTAKSLEELKKLDATKILFYGNMDTSSFNEKLAAQLNVIFTDHGELVQITSKMASKEKAVDLLCKSLKVPLENVIAFGDDRNDFGLFRVCGWPVAMGNAVEELKALAKEVTDTNDNDGVAKILETIL